MYREQENEEIESKTRFRRRKGDTSDGSSPKAEQAKCFCHGRCKTLGLG